MATLDKIQICGIRSFGAEQEDTQTIHFQRPLTLILGENGCGKSTIIECLKFLAAQKEPPGRSAFIHDPTLTNKAHVKASIKLQMNDSRGDSYVLCKGLQATKNKKTISMKTVDSTVSKIDKITKKPDESYSSRCVDFGVEACRIFGISRAILESVVFCTQEDSHWPMETDQKLKEKFDQIFDSDRYNKCVGKARDTKKRLLEEAKRSESELKYLKENKLEAMDKQRRLDRTKGQVVECNNELQELDKNMVDIDGKLKEITNKEMNISKAMGIQESKKTELRSAETNKHELRKHIEVEFDGTDEQLQDEIENFKKLVSVKRQEISSLEEKVMDSNRQEGRLNREMMSEQGRLGQLVKEDELIKDQIKDKNSRLNRLAVELGIGQFNPLQASRDEIQDILSSVKEKIHEKKGEFHEFRQKLAKEEQEIQSKIDKFREQLMTLQNEVTNAEKAIKSNDTEKENVKDKLSEIERSATTLSRLELRLSKTTKEIEDLQSSVNVDELKQNIETGRKEIKRLETRLSEVEAEARLLQQLTAVVAELEVQTDLKTNKVSDFKRLINKHEDSLKGVLGHMPESGFRATVHNHCEQLRRRVRELTAAQSKKDKELTELEMNRKHLKEQLKLKEDTLRNSEEEIYEQCGSDDYEGKVLSLKNEVEELLDVKGALSSSQFMYGRYIRTLEKEDPCCPLCHRNFERYDAAQTLIDELTGKIQEVPDRLDDNQNKLDSKRKKYEQLLTLKPTFERISALKNVEIPQVKSNLEKTEVNIKRVRRELDDLANDVLSPQTDEAICISLQGDMSLLDQLHAEMKRAEKEIERLQSKLGGREASNEILQKTLSEQDSLRKSLKRTRDQTEIFQTNLNQHNEQMQFLQATKNSIMEEKNKIQHGVGQRKQLEDRLATLQEDHRVLSEELNSLKSRLTPVRKSLSELLSNQTSSKADNLRAVDKARNEVTNLEKQLENVETMAAQITASEAKGIGQRIESIKTALSKLEANLETLRMKRAESTKVIDELKKHITNQQTRERELDDNLRYRAKVKQCELLKNEIRELEEKFKDFDCEALFQDKRKWKLEEDRVTKQKARIQGRLGELETQVVQLNRELSNKTYKTAVENYKKELVKYQVTKAAAEDIGRYAVAMEYAMMKYHSLQMDKVNGFAREYWRKIYQGNDIDYIEILTDEVTGTEKRRAYSYRIVQVKNDVKLEMRNRCSAGQKMLASLIIRMALAETFSNNCGILTLDEPTTNLDRKNIKNLARTLAEVLTSKEQLTHSNFQLVVITHDEEFVQALTEVDAVSECVKVKRDHRGKSVVALAKISGTMEEVLVAEQQNGGGDEDYDYD